MTGKVTPGPILRTLHFFFGKCRVSKTRSGQKERNSTQKLLVFLGHKGMQMSLLFSFSENHSNLRYFCLTWHLLLFTRANSGIPKLPKTQPFLTCNRFDIFESIITLPKIHSNVLLTLFTYSKRVICM